MSWKDRVRSQIKFISPSQKEFFAYWQGDNYTREKKLGIFEFPKFDGAIVQDLGLKGTKRPLTIFFTGEDNDTQAKEFVDTLIEKGTWICVHPEEGVLSLQPISFSPDIQPVTSGNLRELKTEWIEVQPDSALPSLFELAFGIRNQVYMVNESAAGQFNSVGVNTASKKLAVKTELEQFIADVQKTIEDYSKKYAEFNKTMTAVRRGLTTAINQSTYSMVGLAGQTQAICNTPGLIAGDISGRFSSYDTLMNRIFTRKPVKVNVESKNTVMTQELALTGVLTGLSQTCISTEIQTREEAIDYIELLTDTFTSITNYLDDTQFLFQNENLFDQYFSQSQAFADLQLLIGKVIAYLLRSLSDLSVAKKITLAEKKAPIRIVIEEYGSLGENDYLLDFFIATNHLKGADIMCIPAGREVVIYPGVA